MGLFNTRTNSHSRSLVIGLDGVPYSLLNSLKEKKIIPNMADIFSAGKLNAMSVCIPEISSVSWSSFMTGTQPGEHGIYGFIDIDPNNYQMFFPNYQNLKTETIWDRVGNNNKKSVILNMPATYPAREINGALVSGFVAPDINKSVFPTSLVSKLKGIDYKIDVNLVKAQQDIDYLIEDLSVTLKRREQAINLLWDEIDWDLFIAVVTGTDRLMHFLWDAYEDSNHDYHEKFINYFKEVDQFVGRIYEKFDSENKKSGSNGSFYMLSDHGFTKIKKEVYINRHLQDNGYVKFKTPEPKSIMEIGPGSRAFALDPSRIYINLKGKYGLGEVDSKDYEKTCIDIKNLFEDIVSDENEKVIKQIFLKEELYSGPQLDHAPDVILLSEHGYDLKGRVNSSSLFGNSNLVGMHTQDNAFFFSSDKDECDTIYDASRIISEKLDSTHLVND